MKYFGCAYYPEYWGRERFEIDAKMMADAGMNMARIGEFAWSRMEPAEGSYSLEWLHECVNILGEHGIDVLMCTPTATPPAWLTSSHPEVLLARPDGSRTMHGSRRHYCSTSPVYRKYSAKITEVLAEEISKHDNIAGWQIDNELGPEKGWCHCDCCQKRFRKWMEERYGNICNLDDCWNTGFWSVDYSEWEQIFLADSSENAYPGRRLDSRRFWNDMMIEYGMEQAAVIRDKSPDTVITTNGMGLTFPNIDYYDLFERMDVASFDMYPELGTLDRNAAELNRYRSFKPGKGFWVTETASCSIGPYKGPEADQFRAWAWSSFARGSEMHCIFRWRSCLSGQEQELQGVIEHSGRPRHRYEMVKKCFSEMKDVCSNTGRMPLPCAEAAIILDYNVLWGYASSAVGKKVNYENDVFRVHKRFFDRNVVTDFIGPDRPLNSYRLVVLPSAAIVQPALAESLATFVHEGGIVLAIGQTGTRDCNFNHLGYPGPDNLQDLLGCEIQGGMYLEDFTGPEESMITPERNAAAAEVPLAGSLNGREISGRASVWMADLTLKGGKVLMAFTSDTYSGQPAVVGNSRGKGRTIYAGVLGMNNGLMDVLLEEAMDLAGIEQGPETPDNVEVVRRGDNIFVINHTPEKLSVKIGVDGEALLGHYNQRGIANLAPYGVSLIQV